MRKQQFNYSIFSIFGIKFFIRYKECCYTITSTTINFIRSACNKNNQLTSSTTDGVVNNYTYDNVGNMLTDGATVTLKDNYTYDANGNRLTKVKERPDTVIKTVASPHNKNNQQRAFKVGLALFLPKG